MIDEKTIRQWWDIFRSDSPLTEVRVLAQNKPYSGYFTSVETMLPQLARFDGVGGIYATLNQVKDSCYGRTQHDEILGRPKSTTNAAAGCSLTSTPNGPAIPTLPTARRSRPT